MSGTTEEKKSIFARIYNWLAQKATAFKNAVTKAFGSIKDWFKSLSLFKTEPLPCCAGKTGTEEPASDSVPAPQQSAAAAAIVPPTGADGMGAAAPVAAASVTIDGTTVASAKAPIVLSAAALAAHDARQSQGRVSASNGSKASSVTSKAS